MRVVFQVAAWFVQAAGACRGALELHGGDAGAAVRGVAREADGAAEVRAGGRRGDRAGRCGVVDADGDRGGGEAAAGVVGGHDAEVVEAVGDEGGVPDGGLVRPAAGAGRGALELHGGDAGAAVSGVAGEADVVPRRFAPAAGAVTEPVGAVLSSRTVTRADAAELPLTSLDERAQVVEAVRVDGRVERAVVRRSRAVARKGRVGVRGALARDLEVDRADAARCAVARGGGHRRAAAEVGRGGGNRQRAAREPCGRRSSARARCARDRRRRSHGRGAAACRRREAATRRSREPSCRRRATSTYRCHTRHWSRCTARRRPRRRRCPYRSPSR